MDNKIQIQTERLIQVISDCIDGDRELEIKTLKKTISDLEYDLDEANDELEDAKFYSDKIGDLEDEISELESKLDDVKERSPKNLYDDQKWQILDELFVKYNLDQLKKHSN
jgi:uncharacterized protein Yka (UPF0111/DUF47 family)